MIDWKVSSTEVEELYRTLDAIGCLGGSREAGYLRAAYSDEETAAMRFIETQAISSGAVSHWDKIGNLSLEWPGSGAHFAEIGSHLDTVPYAGNFDGVAGIVAGLLAIRKIVSLKSSRKAGLRLRIWRGEESATFNTLYIGSLGAFGKFNTKTLSNKFRGKTLEEAMRSQGYNPEVLRSGERTISQSTVDSTLAHLELHIEQGNLLEVENTEVGIVTSIRGPRRIRVILNGEFDHSGATPMGSRYRRDVNLAFGHIIVKLDELSQSQLSRGNDLVQTIGVINSSRDFNESHPKVYENAVPKVSGYGYCCLDIRSNSTAFLDSYIAKVEQCIHETAAKFRVEVTLEPINRSEPLEKLDSDLQQRLEEAAKELKISSMRMASGAGHDTAIVGAQKKSDGTQVPVCMLFIPCKGGKSHAPEEFATAKAIAQGASILARTFYDIVGAG